MKNNLPLISVIIPCRNEEKFIGKCFDSIISQDYPKEMTEVLVVDGMSEDQSIKVVKEYSEKYPFIRLMENPKRFTPFGLNIGIKNAKGEIIIRMDAHAIYSNDYISKCLKYLKEYNADNVGGIIKTSPTKESIIAKSIALALSHPFGVGNSYFRIGSKEPKWVDTVFGGCYKKEIFDRVGLFNENLTRSQDMEFNLRLRRAGGKILLVPNIIAYYYPKSSTLKDFFLYNFKNGFWQTYEFKFTKKPYCLRHYIPLIFILALLGIGILGIFFPVFFWLFLFILGLYFLANFYFFAKIAIKEKNWRYFFVMPLVFTCRHFGHGFGSLIGVIKIFI